MARLSRRSRKRNRQCLLAEAISQCPKPLGWGQGLPVSRRDLLLVRQAIRAGWPVSAEAKRLVVSDVLRVIGSPMGSRMLASVSLAMISMESENQRIDEHCRLLGRDRGRLVRSWRSLVRPVLSQMGDRLSTYQ